MLGQSMTWNAIETSQRPRPGKTRLAEESQRKSDLGDLTIARGELRYAWASDHRSNM